MITEQKQTFTIHIPESSIILYAQSEQFLLYPSVLHYIFKQLRRFPISIPLDFKNSLLRLPPVSSYYQFMDYLWLYRIVDHFKAIYRYVYNLIRICLQFKVVFWQIVVN